MKALFSLLLLSVDVNPTTATDLCLLPLGNSITQGNSAHDSWRYPLWKRLVDSGSFASISTAGSLTTHHGGSRAHASYRNLNFPSRHEGHWAWTADRILANLP